MRKLAAIASIGALALLASGCSDVLEPKGETIITPAILEKPADMEGWERIDIGHGFFLNIPSGFTYENDSDTALLMSGEVDVAGQESGQLQTYIWEYDDKSITATLVSKRLAEEWDGQDKPDTPTVRGNGFTMQPSHGGMAPFPSDSSTSFSYDYVEDMKNGWSAMVTVDYGELVPIDADKDGIIDYDKHIKNFYLEFISGSQSDNQFAQSPANFVKFDLDSSLDGSLYYDKFVWNEEFDPSTPAVSTFTRHDEKVKVRLLSDIFLDEDGEELFNEQRDLLAAAREGETTDEGYHINVLPDENGKTVVAWAVYKTDKDQVYATAMRIVGDKSVPVEELMKVGGDFYNSYDIVAPVVESK